MISKALMLSVVIVVVLVAAFYLPAMVQSPTSTTSVTTSTSSSSCTTSTISSSSTSISSTSSTQSSTSATTTASTSTSTSTTSSSGSNVTYGQFNFSPASPVRIESVEAVTSTDNSGNTIVTFEALFENTGHAPVYILGGCGGGFSSSIVGNSSVIQAVPDGPLCDCAAIIISLDQNQNHTSVNPGCWSGYSYHLVSEGMVTMNMTLTWSNNGQGFVGTNSTSIQAEFNFT